jgi:hypothetical protein
VKLVALADLRALVEQHRQVYCGGMAIWSYVALPLTTGAARSADPMRVALVTRTAPSIDDVERQPK